MATRKASAIKTTKTKVAETAEVNEVKTEEKATEDIADTEKAVEAEETVKEVEEVATPVQVEKKEYKNEDGIVCHSIFAGKYFYKGLKSGILYSWNSRGDETEVEYQDIVAAIRSNAPAVIKPFIIVDDNEVVEKFPQLKTVYNNMYTRRDLKEILDLPIAEMKATILALPDGAKDSIKHIAASQVANGFLDSVKKIQAIDEIFDTKLMAMTKLYQ